MNCEEFKLAVGAEPATTRQDVLAHAASCASCSEYRADMLALNGMIHRALRVEAAGQRPAIRPAIDWRIAAMILITVTALSIGWLAYPRTTFAEQVVAHVLHEEPELAQSDNRLDRRKVREVLDSAGVHLSGADLPVSYARVCNFRKHDIAHLIVQTKDGPVAVLVLPDEPTLRQPRRFEEQGFSGTFVPAPRGLIAVLAREGAVDAVAATTLKALSYAGQ